MSELYIAERQEAGRWTPNRAEKPRQPFRRRERRSDELAEWNSLVT
ncbi:MAG: hypothetical protein ACK5T5_07670 [Phenylobacterium sp.]|jgi:hypothetical protein